MEDKPIYKVIDQRGRITIPAQLRDKAGIETGDIVELITKENTLLLQKTEVVHIDASTQRSLQSTVNAAIVHMDKNSLLKVSKRIMCELEKKGE